ncbi:hypothetical protein MATL_G00085830 [Megalops atlanticus]|uniref:Uncharacterized protein n=1 Tax=Megalops atlanticus TaxID=7932 RepID=A0A9D3Q3P8_MEGAT|nr:hypothetical protein MATL_G00085830 [Megalops atlanticus]
MGQRQDKASGRGAKASAIEGQMCAQRRDRRFEERGCLPDPSELGKVDDGEVKKRHSRYNLSDRAEDWGKRKTGATSGGPLAPVREGNMSKRDLEKVTSPHAKEGAKRGGDTAKRAVLLTTQQPTISQSPDNRTATKERTAPLPSPTAERVWDSGHGANSDMAQRERGEDPHQRRHGHSDTEHSTSRKDGYSDTEHSTNKRNSHSDAEHSTDRREYNSDTERATKRTPSPECDEISAPSLERRPAAHREKDSMALDRAEGQRSPMGGGIEGSAGRERLPNTECETTRNTDTEAWQPSASGRDTSPFVTSAASRQAVSDGLSLTSLTCGRDGEGRTDSCHQIQPAAQQEDQRNCGWDCPVGRPAELRSASSQQPALAEQVPCSQTKEHPCVIDILNTQHVRAPGDTLRTGLTQPDSSDQQRGEEVKFQQQGIMGERNTQAKTTSDEWRDANGEEVVSSTPAAKSYEHTLPALPALSSLLKNTERTEEGAHGNVTLLVSHPPKTETSPEQETEALDAPSSFDVSNVRRPMPKGPPPPVPKKPKNPFLRPEAARVGLESSRHRDRQSAQADTWTGQWEATPMPTLREVWDGQYTHSTALRQTPPPSMWVCESQPPPAAFLLDRRRQTPPMELERDSDFTTSSISPSLSCDWGREEPTQPSPEKGTRTKGPPPPVPKKPKFRLISLERERSMLAAETGPWALSQQDPEPESPLWVLRTDTEPLTKPSSDSVWAGLLDQNHLDAVEGGEPLPRPVAELIKERMLMQERSRHQDWTGPSQSRAAAALEHGQSVKVALMKKTFDVQKRTTERKPENPPKKSKMRPMFLIPRKEVIK